MATSSFLKPFCVIPPEAIDDFIDALEYEPNVDMTPLDYEVVEDYEFAKRVLEKNIKKNRINDNKGE